MNQTVHNSSLNNASSGLTSIVIPTYQEADNLRPIITQISEVMLHSGSPFEIIIVDDDSRDGSEEITQQLVNEGFPVRFIKRTNQRGLSTAVIRGFQEARGDIFICMDADLSHPPEAIPKLLNCLNTTDAEFVIGSRYISGGSTDESWSPFRWFTSKVATQMARPFTWVKDPMSGFFAIPRNVFDRAKTLNPIGYKIGLELMVRCSCQNVCEIPIHFTDRKHGQSKFNLVEQINYIRHLLRLAVFKLRGHR